MSLALHAGSASGGDGSPVPPSPPQANACCLGEGEEEGKELFPSCHCSSVACDLCFSFARSGGSGRVCAMAAGTQAAGCWHVLALGLHLTASVMSSLWETVPRCKSWSMGGVIYGKRNRILSYILANMVNFYIQ